jgi:hypothetical protein
MIEFSREEGRVSSVSALPFDRPSHPAGRTAPGASDAELQAMFDAPARKRTRLCELSPTLHCSIVGTCLSTGELRQIVSKSKGVELDHLGDHEIHGEGVRLAARSDGAGKLLQKALDKRHQAAINRFAKAQSAGEVAALWDDAKRAGEIPAAYWATISHPAANDALVKAAFADVHMLSHLVGAANRADIRRLTKLQAENAALEAKLQKCQAHLQAAETRNRQAAAALASILASPAEPAQAVDRDEEVAALRRLVGDLEARLGTEASRRQRLEERDEQSRRRAAAAHEEHIAAERREAALAKELAALEAHLDTRDAVGDEAPRLPANVATLLYVGGRPTQIHRLRDFADRAGLALLHHDGGVEDRPGLLPGLVSRADAACFPVDCVSHDAVAAVKRLCRQAAKPYLALRSVGLGSFLAGLAKLADAPGGV